MASRFSQEQGLRVFRFPTTPTLCYPSRTRIISAKKIHSASIKAEESLFASSFSLSSSPISSHFSPFFFFFFLHWRHGSPIKSWTISNLSAWSSWPTHPRFHCNYQRISSAGWSPTSHCLSSSIHQSKSWSGCKKPIWRSSSFQRHFYLDCVLSSIISIRSIVSWGRSLHFLDFGKERRRNLVWESISYRFSLSVFELIINHLLLPVKTALKIISMDWLWA